MDPKKTVTIAQRSVFTEEKKNFNMNMKEHPKQRPVVGGIYRDKSGNSLAVVNIIGNKALLEYANGTLTTVDINNWQLLHAQSAIF